MNEELMVAIEELRQRAASRSWFIPVSLDGCAIPDRNIGAGETLHDLHWVDLTADWNRGVELIARAVGATNQIGVDDHEQAVESFADDEDAGLLDAVIAFLSAWQCSETLDRESSMPLLSFMRTASSKWMKSRVAKAWLRFAMT